MCCSFYEVNVTFGNKMNVEAVTLDVCQKYHLVPSRMTLRFISFNSCLLTRMLFRRKRTISITHRSQNFK